MGSNTGRIPHSVLKKLRDVAVVTCWVKRNTLTVAPWNPDIRVQIQYLKDLRASLHTEGYWEFAPMLVDRDGIIIDGNRRYTACSLEGIEDVCVTIVDVNAQDLWAKYNGSRMEITGAQAMQAMSKGLKTPPTKFADQMNKLINVLGQEDFDNLGRRGASPFVLNQAIRIARYCSLEDDKPFVGLAIWWLINNKRMTTVTSRAIQEQIDPMVLERKIRGNIPLTIDYR